MPMTPESIAEHLHRRPFQPFRIFLLDGRNYDVRHPEMAWVSRETLIVAKEMADEGLPSRETYCDPYLVSRIELINGERPKRRKGRQSKPK